MPQHTHIQHSLIHILLLWITVLSIAQIVFIVLFFTAGHHDLSQNSDAVTPERPMPIRANNTPSPLSDPELPLGKGLMLIFKITEVNGNMKLVAKNPHQGLISEERGKFLKIKMDGYFFLNLRVTLLSCNETWESQHTVSLKMKGKDILKGGINKNTSCTSLLSKVEVLTAGDTLEVNLPANAQIDEDNSQLDIIYMRKP
ncbi:hypothetical protein PFLUV_G00177950 [Perca fluviatilis]|uniref:TNF family profile domain-containing protein n=1 Tax=Perca fluviatilis TaxID=8168 RepID=A0A6A5EYN0_PERFL|nr:hypothetical protein PFLUV_G00177950 [Perca fluviatilis]